MDKIHLIKLCQSGDREALGILYQTYLIPMREIVAYYVNNTDAVWDILHDGFLVAFASICSLKNSEKVEPWLASIMKNLAFQYLRDKSKKLSVPLSDISIATDIDEANPSVPELIWEELDRIIHRLPSGYGKVFRLAVLDGLSHKEIGSLLGIASHSSSSQLSHAKAMMRRMIMEYRMEIGAFSIVAIGLFMWRGIFKHRENTMSTYVISKNVDNKTNAVIDQLSNVGTGTYGIISRSEPICKINTYQRREIVADVTSLSDSVAAIGENNVANDSIKSTPAIMDKIELSGAQKDSPRTLIAGTNEWTLSLAYAYTIGQQYGMSPNPDFPINIGAPGGESEVTEKARHHIPVVIGLSLNKNLASRWSIETGIRYSFLRSDFMSESEQAYTETIQRIHYIGVPFKFNYRIFAYKGFSLYGQGGGALDIPVYGIRSVRKSYLELGATSRDVYRINAPLQWSLEGGLGIQYHILPSFSIYAEPSLRYYFNPGSDIRTIRQETPFEFTIPLGLRLTW